MAKRTIQTDPGPELDALVAERVMGWREVERQGNRSWGKKRDRAGRWRRAAVPDYSEDLTASYAIDERMKELGLWQEYSAQLARAARAKRLPQIWAPADQRCLAALRAVAKSRRPAAAHQ